jgi:hypothetical protein
MPPNGLPISDQSTQGPGAFAGNCHSDVTLAAHANLLAPMIAEATFNPALDLLSAQHFDVPATA